MTTVGYYLIGSISSQHFVEYIDSLPSRFLDEDQITVQLHGATDMIANHNIWASLAIFVKKHSDYWRIESFSDNTLMRVSTADESSWGIHTTTTHEVSVLLRAVGVSDL